MVSKLTYGTLEDYMRVFRIGIFLAHVLDDMPTWEGLRDFLRKQGFTSAFLVKDYPSNTFENNRKKSFRFLRECHAAFFVFEKEMGGGGAVSELEEYKREVYPKKGRIAAMFEKCSFVEGRVQDEPSTVIAPNLTEDKFYMRRFMDRQELPSMFLGMAAQLIFGICRQPYMILDPPKFRLSCQFCGKRESRYMCLERCEHDCNLYHICRKCAGSPEVLECTSGGNSLYEL